MKRPIGGVWLNEGKRPIGGVWLNEVKRHRKLVLAGFATVIAVVAALVVAGHLRTRQPSDCDTVRDLLTYNQQFTEQTKTSAQTNNPELSTVEQYRDWAARLKDYSAQIHDPALSARARSAADLAARTADLVPRYRANPDDVEVGRQYARTGIEFGNAITNLDYACPGSAS
ncbi:MAG: hypothetical protein KIH64_006395 [Mycobacterium sp.]|nr:hypothetical protein [Mycobacterium sp.]